MVSCPSHKITVLFYTDHQFIFVKNTFIFVTICQNEHYAVSNITPYLLPKKSNKNSRYPIIV